jgi:hypothetical protein
VTVDYPINMDPPIVYDLTLDDQEEKKLCKIQAVVERERRVDDDDHNNNNRNLARWVKRHVVHGQAFRFEWK